jgi:hypothetical protein
VLKKITSAISEGANIAGDGGSWLRMVLGRDSDHPSTPKWQYGMKNDECAWKEGAARLPSCGAWGR